MRPFAQNMRKARLHKEWSQTKAAKMIGISQQSVGAYEEDRGQPNAGVLTKICKAYGIVDVLSFINDPDFDMTNQTYKPQESILQERFEALTGNVREAVMVLMGMN